MEGEKTVIKNAALYCMAQGGIFTFVITYKCIYRYLQIAVLCDVAQCGQLIS